MWRAPKICLIFKVLLHEKQDKVIIIIKNISKEKLNISSDELMQRFVNKKYVIRKEEQWTKKEM